jgi:hypothetical protein
MWRWDQGRLEYFQYDEIKNIAKSLVKFDGHSLPKGGDPDTLRSALSEYSNKPFAPCRGDYPVWRNYGRVFGCQLLAAKIGGILVVTDLCKKLAADQLDVDDYLLHFATHFYYPSPSFEGYATTTLQTFPITIVIKFLLSKYLSTPYPFTTVEELADKVIGNNLIGKENVADYIALKSTGFKLTGDSIRQIRELLIFISQFSFLKWVDKKLFLDISSKEQAVEIEKSIVPFVIPRNTDPAKEIIAIGGNIQDTKLGEFTSNAILNFMDQEFIEGNKTRVTHLRSERSGKLRDIYFSYFPNPHICNMCSINTVKKYPWADRIIELHHLLPLSSPVGFENEATTLKDLVGLCPSCHRATHKYYTKYLKSKSLTDFRTYQEAHNVYNEAKSKILLV